MSVISSFFSFLFSAVIPCALFSVGIFFCISLRAFHIRHPIRTLRRAFSGGGRGQIRALLMALGGTLGVGNIAGVAIAIIYGGAGSVFWMWVSAFSVMLIKYAEALLAQRYRSGSGPDLEGGAVYYIRYGAKMRHLASLFGVLCILSALAIGALIQSNAIAQSISLSFDISTVAVGGILALLVFFLSLFGQRETSSLLSVIVPFMSAMYMVMAFCIIFSNLDGIPSVFSRIFREAFSLRAAGSGGTCGLLVSLRYGALRGLFSNEAGVGTSPMAHATADSDYPARQGVMGIVEVFCDTILLCSLTAITVLLAFPQGSGGTNGVELVIDAFSLVFGSASGILVSLCIFFFAFATIILWAYYLKVCVHYFTSKAWIDIALLTVYAIAVAFGATLSEGRAWLFCDIITSTMTVLNLFVLVKLSPQVREETERFGLIEQRKVVR